MQPKEERKFTIGRSRECDIVLSDPSVNRKHAELIFMPDGKLFLIDCRSQNGTSLLENGKAQPIRQEFLSPTDEVQFGDSAISVKDILEGIKLKFQALNAYPVSVMPGESDQSAKPWVHGARLVRCSCGAVKKKAINARACGR